jgi:NADH dehydrogenase/NADH:ubiquinone oxidoreductase subunit G
MKFYTLAVGALTSKPYAFTARSWELTSSETIDFFDTLGSNIRVDTRGSEIMRILPKINNKINDEWISDKVRFSYDGLKQQRLNNPMLRINGDLVNVNWLTALKFLANKISNVSAVNFIVGNFIDLETQFVLKLLSSRIGGYVSHSDLSARNNDLRNNYLLNTNLDDLSKVDVFLLLGTNLRFENPVLNLKIRKRVMEGASVFTFGNNMNLDYNTINIGNSIGDLIALLEGKHLLARRLLKFKKPLVLIGAGMEHRIDSEALFNAIKILENYLGLNVVSSLIVEVSKLNNLEINSFTKMNSFPKQYNAKMLYILGADNIVIDSDKFDCIVYQGHHGDRIAALADLVLPAVTPYERTGTYLNVNGKYQVTKFIHVPPGNARNDWKIFKALADLLGIGMEVNDMQILRLVMHKSVTEMEQNFNVLLEKRFNGILNTTLSSHIEDYYMNDSISRSSYIMALCSNRFNKKISFNK